MTEHCQTGSFGNTAGPQRPFLSIVQSIPAVIEETSADHLTRIRKMSDLWEQGDSVRLEVADTLDPQDIGRSATGVVQRVYDWKAGSDRQSIAAFIRLETPLLDGVSNVIVLLRSRLLISRIDSVSVVPWSHVAPAEAQINDLAMKYQGVCIALMKILNER
jgi:hypothetical protein